MLIAMGSANFHLSVSSTLLNLFVWFTFVRSVNSLCLPDERSALLHLKQSFTINASASTDPYAYPKTESWNLDEQSGDCCAWDGVECDNSTGHVVVLDLSSSYLYGSIDSTSSLFRLVRLESLMLADNAFVDSEIPSEIRNLSRLTHLDLYRSSFSGQVPVEILDLSKLEHLDLSENSLMLRDPGLSSLLHKLTNLKQLYLTDVKISSSVPNILGKFTSLIALSLSNCDLRGKFPIGVFELPNLEFLNLESNQKLSGTLPNDVQDNHPLSVLILADTSFYGRLPESIGKFKSLVSLDISNCRFSGKLPCSVSNLTQLKLLDLFSNNFSQPIPSSIGNLNQLETLELSENKFSGPIPSSLANLTRLVYLSLANNSFDQGPLSCIGTQTNLTYLDLSNTNLTGEIPSSLRYLTRISVLYLPFNKLNGHIPHWIGSLTELTEIKLQENYLSGPIPDSIFMLRSLELLYLYRNQLNGTLELQSFIELKNLTRLQLSGNHLSLLSNVSMIDVTRQKFKLLGLAACNLTEFPSFLRGQDELEILELGGNEIRGRIPNWFMHVGKQSLQYLNLGNNSLIGFHNFPSILPWTSLKDFNLDFNMLQGPLPRPPPSIASYTVSNNLLSGQITSMFCNLSSLEVLDLSYNNMSGTLPTCFSSLSDSLQVLNLQHNHLTGAIPSTYTNKCGLRAIDLSQNRLQGTIPRSLAKCTQLEELILGNNLISDGFPYWLGSLPKLKLLILRSNRLHGAIPKPQTGSEFSKLQVIDLSDNHLNGKLPSDYFNVWNAMKVANTETLYMFAKSSFRNKDYVWYSYYNYTVTFANKGRYLKYDKVPDSIHVIDLSSNEFEGEIPDDIGDLKLVRVLNFSNNNLHGRIPASLSEISDLESLDLARNHLSGEIPPRLSELNFLVVFNVSYNKLEGPIPEGAQFNTYDKDSYEGNSGLCGYPLLAQCGSPRVSCSSPNEDEDRGIWSVMKLGWRIVLTGYGAGFIFGMSIGWNFNAWKIPSSCY